ncbi:MAG: hypothetical protein HYV97_18290 [Bdellovibrio sp.]|nr:hypothetical protein [Bdellovibrio sp.]
MKIHLFLTLLILIAGHFFLIPKSLRYYCLEYFSYCPLHRHLLLRVVRYFAFSLAGVALSAWQFPLTSMPLLGLFAILFSATIIFDLELQIIPDWIHWLGIPATMTFILTKLPLVGKGDLFSMALAIGLPLGLLTINFIFSKLTKGEGLGSGDIKLLFWLSLLAGPSIYSVFALAVVIALLQNIFRIIRRRKETFPFGPAIIYAFCLFFIKHALWVNPSKFHL